MFSLPFSHPVLIFATVMVLILVSPILARRLRLPSIVGLILAGMVFGEHGIGLLARDDTIKLLGQVGLLLIMFMAGLEIDLHQVRKHRSHSVVFGLLTFAIPLSMGVFLGQWVLGMALPTAILMSSMFSSHTLLTFPTIGKLGLAKARSTTTTIGGTIITDTLALLTLAVIAASTAGDLNVEFWVGLSAKIILYMTAVVIFVPMVGRLCLRRFSTDEDIEFISVYAIAFSVSYLAYVAGLEPIIGAFLAGLTLNSLIPEKGGLMARIRFTGNALFIPFFLISVGMLVNVGLLWKDMDAWKVIAVMVFVALLAKWLAAQLSGRLLRYSWEEAGLIYGLSVNQAAATLAAGLVGYDIGLFDDTVITGTIVMIGVTCFVGPIFTERWGRRVAAGSRHEAEAASVAPRRVMLPVRSREQGRDMLELAMFLRAEGSHEPLYPVHVVFEGPQTEAAIAHGEHLLAELVVRSVAVNVPVTPLVVVDTNIASGILRAARENRASVISLVWDGQSHARPHVFGHIVSPVVDRSGQMVLVTRVKHALGTMRRILLLCPPLIDWHPGFVDALAAVKTIAHQAGTTLVLMAPSDALDAFEKVARRIKPDVRLEFLAYSNWKSIGDSIADELEPDDWPVVITARMGEMAWQPSSDRLPRRLATRCPEHNLTFIHPPTEPRRVAPDAEHGAEAGIVGEILQPDRCRFGVPTGDLRTALEQVLASCFRERGRNADRVVDSLITVARTEPVEMTPGLVLLHTRCDEVDSSETFLVVTAEPMELPNVEPRPQAALVLLDPAGYEPAKHLAALADIAAMTKLPGFVEQAKAVSSYEDFIRRMAGAE